jgi:hypothetical protein
MRSGGYSISSKIPSVQQETLILWGRQDEILEPKYAAQFEAALPNRQLQWIEDCGHCGQLEKPTEVAARILEFIGATQAPAARAGGEGAAVSADAAAVPAMAGKADLQ